MAAESKILIFSLLNWSCRWNLACSHFTCICFWWYRNFNFVGKKCGDDVEVVQCPFKCAKMQFQAKICILYVKITAKLVNVSKCRWSTQNLQSVYKIWYENGKRGSLSVDWRKKRGVVIGCKIGVKRWSIDRHLIATDICECSWAMGGNPVRGAH